MKIAALVVKFFEVSDDVWVLAKIKTEASEMSVFFFSPGKYWYLHPDRQGGMDELVGEGRHGAGQAG
jgi:hypothetical protein